jgi:hypothetical protein
LRAHDLDLLRRHQGAMLLGRMPKTRAEIEDLLLAEVRAAEACAGVASISVMPWNDDDPEVNWTIDSYDIGSASMWECQGALEQIVPRFQSFYELVQKH